jgi:hypothetical protein
MKKAVLVVLLTALWGGELAKSEVPTIWPTVGLASLRGSVAPPAHPMTANDFGELADGALLAMRNRAGELKVGGVAIVAYFEGDSIQSWDSKMIVVGRMKDNPSPTDKGSNLLAIAYAKAAEMADTLKDSGSHVRPPMTGEYGWNGGIIVRGKKGYLIAAFSGGKDQDDVSISRIGVAVLEKGL